jgi:monothiol glutaredoxin
MSDNPIFAQIENDIKTNPVMLYMKGTPEQPQCGFSAAVIATLQRLNAPFATRNVLADENLRQGIKDFSNWPTIPQLYVNGEFVGGNDIVQQLAASGELAKMVNQG